MSKRDKITEKVKTDSSDSSESGSETVYVAQKAQNKRHVDHNTESNESTDSETERVHELNDDNQATNAQNIIDDFPNDRVQPEVPEEVVKRPPVPRRSKRTHTPLYWKRSGEYVHAQRSQNPNWIVKANYLKSMALNGIYIRICLKRPQMPLSKSF